MPQTQFAKLTLKPGVFNDHTDYASEGRWVSADKVRFWKGYAETIGGWEAVPNSLHSGVCRKIFDSSDLARIPFTLFGTDTGLYVMQDAVQADITPAEFTLGSEGVLAGDGYGVGVYGDDTYGTTRTTTLIQRFTKTWSFDYWGQDFMLCSATLDNLYLWDIKSENVATLVSNAPTLNLGSFVTPERHAVAVGPEGNFRTLQWCDQENLSDWDYTSPINTAGRFTIPGGSMIVAWLQTSGGTLIWTDQDLWFMSYVGWPDIFRFDKVGTKCGAISQNAVTEIKGIVYWMGIDGFWYYDGAVHEAPCTVERHVFQNINQESVVKSFSGANTPFSEVWFFYPDGNSIEPNRYVILSVEEGWWSTGAMTRSAWTHEGRTRTPLSASPDTQLLYLQEKGETADGSPLVASLVSAPREIDNGGTTIRAHAIVPDMEATNGIKVTLGARFMPAGSLYEYAPIEFTPTDVRRPLMLAGRQVRVKIESLSTGGFWRLGNMRFDMRGAGAR